MNKYEKTLVILTPGFAKDEADTTCLPLQQQLIRTLKELNPQINIILLSLQYPFHTKEYTWFNVTVIPLNAKSGLPKLLLRSRLNATLKQIHDATPITSLLSFWYGECAVAGKKFADKYGLKHFCWILGQDAKKENKYPRQSRLKAGELIALSDFLRDEFEKNHEVRPAHLIPAGINTRLFIGKKEKDIDILGVGSLIPLKQYDLFIETIAEIKKRIPGLKAMLIGKGPEENRLRTLIEKLGLQSNVIVTGELSYHEVLERMQRAKVLLHPSCYEGFSGVCLEALFAGAHVISFCKAMNQEIEQWHIVSSKQEMVQTSIDVLQGRAIMFKSVLFSSIEELANKMAALLFKSA